MANLDKLFGVHGMVFVVTGGGSGLGEMMALALDANGARQVFVLGRRKASLEKVAAKAANGRIIPVACDIASKESLQKAVASIEGQVPFVNAVVANSGVSGPFTGMPPRAADAKIVEIQEQFWNLAHE
ncbi:MAG: hypothetical protein M1820_006969 [Bogoriella megaspora]|nr:MAG: hypothetical protein M1820_006969 [Bogoriella megaspora]